MAERVGNKIRFLLGLYVGKTLQVMIKIFYPNSGTNLPGRCAIWICPDFLSMIGKPKTVIAVTGTNGKTTVSHFLNANLSQNGYRTVNNSKGSNMPSGIASALMEASDWLGRVHRDVAIFEVDERASAFVYVYITPTHLICTNLFRDSIKRNGHSEFIFNKLKSSIPKTTTLILNADDLISSRLGEENEKIFFSINGQKGEREFDNIVRDAAVCPLCRTRLNFAYRHYHHIGKVSCPNCSYSSPTADFIGVKMDVKKKKMVIAHRGALIHYPLVSESIFSAYNMISAVAVLSTWGLTHEQIKLGFAQVEMKQDRLARFKFNNREIITMLAKNQNPISCSRVFDYVSNQSGSKAVVLLITDSQDKAHGSEDISWLYDTDFEYLSDPKIKQIIIGGTRGYDVALRLKLAGVSAAKISIQTDYQGIEDLVDYSAVNKIYILYEVYAYSLSKNLQKRMAAKVGETHNVTRRSAIS